MYTTTTDSDHVILRTCMKTSQDYMYMYNTVE